MANWRIGTKLLVLTVPLIAVATLLATWTLHTRNAERLQEMLKHRAHSIAAQVMADRQYYGAVVVPRVGDLKGSLGADYRDIHGRFPLPRALRARGVRTARPFGRRLRDPADQSLAHQ